MCTQRCIPSGASWMMWCYLVDQAGEGPWAAMGEVVVLSSRPRGRSAPFFFCGKVYR